MKLKAYRISRTLDIGPKEFASKVVIVLGSNPYNAFFTFREASGLPEAHSDDIGDADTPCVRFIINQPCKPQQRYYVTPYNKEQDD